MSNITRAANPHLLVDPNAGTLTVSGGVLDANGNWIDVTVRGCNPSFLAQVRAGIHPEQKLLSQKILEAWQAAVVATTNDPAIRRLTELQSLDADKISFVSNGRQAEVRFPGSDTKGRANAALMHPSVELSVKAIQRIVNGFKGVAHQTEGSPTVPTSSPSPEPPPAPSAATQPSPQPVVPAPSQASSSASSQTAVAQVPALPPPEPLSQRAPSAGASPRGGVQSTSLSSFTAPTRSPAQTENENVLSDWFQTRGIYRGMRPQFANILRDRYRAHRFPFDNEAAHPPEQPPREIVDYFLNLSQEERRRIAERLRRYPDNRQDHEVREYLLTVQQLAPREVSVATHREALWYLLAPLFDEIYRRRGQDTREIAAVTESIFRALGLREGFLPEERPRPHRAIGWGDVASFLLMLALAGADHFMRRRLFGL